VHIKAMSVGDYFDGKLERSMMLNRLCRVPNY
jgi:hypothetical protein